MKKKIFLIIILLTIAMVVYGYVNVGEGNCEIAINSINIA
jgi:hypothetical protein